jgi:hypothetical protein
MKLPIIRLEMLKEEEDNFVVIYSAVKFAFFVPYFMAAVSRLYSIKL